LIRELPNTPQFRAAADPKGGGVGVRVTQNGDAAALAAYMATVKPYDFSWQPNYGNWGGTQAGQSMSGECWFPAPCSTGYNALNGNSDYNKPNPYFGVAFDGNGNMTLVIGGAGDQMSILGHPIGTGNVNGVERVIKDTYGNDQSVRVYGWSEVKQMLADVQASLQDNSDRSVSIVGHSWGAWTGVNLSQQLAQNGIPVQNLITLDGVRRLDGAPDANASFWTNVTATPETRNLSDSIASIGRALAPFWSIKADTTIDTRLSHDESVRMIQAQNSDGVSALSTLGNSSSEGTSGSGSGSGSESSSSPSSGSSGN
jgi:hypothetical protein